MTLTIIPAAAISETSHRLFAPTLAELYKEMHKIGKGIGKATHPYSWSWNKLADGRLNIELTMTMRLFMPVWMKVTSRPDPEKIEWRRWHKALAWHEKGHHVICQREVHTMYANMQAANKKTVDGVFGTEVKRIQDLQDAYDKKTDHGVVQQSPYGTTVLRVPPY
jgi:hypothetical protein